MYKQAFLHVGYDKAGSTALQDLSTARHSQLQLLGIHYPKPLSDNNHRLITSAFMADPSRANINQATGRPTKTNTEIRQEDRRFLRTYEQQIEGGHGTLFLSFEGFIWLSAEEHVKLRDWVLNYAPTVKVIIYVRDPVGYAESAISQRVRTGRSIVVTHHHHDLNIAKLVEAYGRSNVIVRKFDRQAMQGGDIRHDCYSLIGLERHRIDELVSCKPALKELPNQSLSMHAIGLGEALQKELEGTEFQATAGAEFRFLSMFSDLLGSIPGPRYRLNLPEQRELLSRPQVRAASRYLLEEFGVEFRSKTRRLLGLSAWKPYRNRSLFNTLRQQGFYTYFAKILVEQMSSKINAPVAADFTDAGSRSVHK